VLEVTMPLVMAMLSKSGWQALKNEGLIRDEGW
jgi:hypothetical protein